MVARSQVPTQSVLEDNVLVRDDEVRDVGVKIKQLGLMLVVEIETESRNELLDLVAEVRFSFNSAVSRRIARVSPQEVN